MQNKSYKVRNNFSSTQNKHVEMFFYIMIANTYYRHTIKKYLSMHDK